MNRIEQDQKDYAQKYQGIEKTVAFGTQNTFEERLQDRISKLKTQLEELESLKKYVDENPGFSSAIKTLAHCDLLY